MSFAEVTDGHEDDRDRQENPERERTGQPRQDQKREDHRRQRLAGVHDSGAEHHADVVEIVGGARHQLAGAIADVKLRLHHEEAIEEVATNVELDVARNADQNPPRCKRKSAFEQNADEKNQTIDAERVTAVRGVKGNRAAQRRAGKQMRLANSIRNGRELPAMTSVMTPVVRGSCCRPGWSDSRQSMPSAMAPG